MAKIPHFPWYPDDWISSRKRLKMTYYQQGIYSLLLSHSWNEPLPLDIEEIKTLCPKARERDILVVLECAFERGANGYTNHKLNAIRTAAEDISSKRSYAAKCLHNNKIKEANAEQMQSKCTANQNQNQNQNHKKKESKPSVRKNRDTDSRIAEVIKYFYEKCESDLGFKPVINGQDGQRVKEALKIMSVEDIKLCIDFFLPSRKAKEMGATLSIALSAHTINLYRQGGGNGTRFDQLRSFFGISEQQGPGGVSDIRHEPPRSNLWKKAGQGRGEVLDGEAQEIPEMEDIGAG